MIVLDSSFLIGFYNERDSHQAVASVLMERFAEAAIAHVAETRANGLVLAFDEELARVTGMHVPATEDLT